MRIRYAYIVFVFLLGCAADRQVVLPDGMVPKRKDLTKDTYGGYLRLTTTTNETIHGEFIGMHQDSLVIWENRIKLLHPTQIDQAQLYIYDFNSYLNVLYFSLIPNVAMLVHIPNYGIGPLIVAALFSGIDLIGVGTAEYKEKKIMNYYDWNRDRDQFLLYARFPQGLPADVPLFSIKGKNIMAPIDK